jgi:hypothetical protein
MRGRNNNNNNNNNRKGPNPLTRNYESNGPDVKIRGSAQQIAEKYATLARDAQSAGDRVMAENYLQHAEHYNRIIAAAQAQMPIQNFQNNRDDFDDELDEERDDQQQPDTGGNQQGEAQPAFADGSGPQPAIEGTPAEVALNPEAAGQPQRQERQNGYHTNGNAGNGEENFRRNRRPRRGRGGRQDIEQQGGDQGQGDDAGGDTGLPEQLMQPIVRRQPAEEPAAGEASAKEPAADDKRPEPAGQE